MGAPGSSKQPSERRRKPRREIRRGRAAVCPRRRDNLALARPRAEVEADCCELGHDEVQEARRG
eukprot:8393625-Pyramimonas_sp.AAC.1